MTYKFPIGSPYGLLNFWTGKTVWLHCYVPISLVISSTKWSCFLRIMLKRPYLTTNIGYHLVETLNASMKGDIWGPTDDVILKVNINWYC